MATNDASYIEWLNRVDMELRRVTKGETIDSFEYLYDIFFVSGVPPGAMVNKILGEAGYWEFLKDEKYPQE